MTENYDLHLDPNDATFGGQIVPDDEDEYATFDFGWPTLISLLVVLFIVGFMAGVIAGPYFTRPTVVCFPSSQATAVPTDTL